MVATPAPFTDTETWLPPGGPEVPVPEPPVAVLPAPLLPEPAPLGVPIVEAAAEVPLAIRIPPPQPERTRRLQKKEKVKRCKQEGIGSLRKFGSVLQGVIGVVQRLVGEFQL